MDTKKDDGFLTCLEACDTIAMLAEVDFETLMMNSVQLCEAFTIILDMDLTELPEYAVTPVAKMQKVVYEFLGIEALGDYENFNSSTRH